MKRMIFPKKILSLSLVIIIMGLFIFFFSFQKKSESTLDIPLRNGASDVKEELKGIPVKVVTAQRGNLIIKLESQGEAVAKRKVIIKAEAAGVIKALHVEEGREVKKGDVLMELDDREYRLELERIEALRLKYLSELFLEKKFAGSEKNSSPAVLEKIEKAQREYERAKRLYADSRISKEVFSQVKMNYELVLIETGRKKEEIRAASLTQAEIDAEIAQMKLEKTRIKAPFSGVITNICVCPQEYISLGSELCRLVDIHKIKVEAKVLESEIVKIKEGQEVDLRFNAYPDKIFKGIVRAMSPEVHPKYKTCKVIICFPNPPQKIRPGMQAEVRIAAEIYRDRVLIPQEAILVRRGRKLVFAVEEGLAKWRYIEVGVENEQFVEVLDGIEEGEIVITKGHFTLAHDTRVEIAQ
jgi:RND family efflux transporter MFP subunit